MKTRRPEAKAALARKLLVTATALCIACGAANSVQAQALNLSDLDGTDGFVINGIDADDLSAISISGAGDVNGDGFDDLIIGAPGGDPNGKSDAGESYVVFGSDGGFAASLELSALNGANGFVINGIDIDDGSGASVSEAGDVNGDGIDDLIIGAVRGDPHGKSAAGESYVVFGNDQGFPASLELSALNGANGFVINGIDANDSSGRSVSGTGDVNGDGIDDLIVGACTGEDTRIDESYVVFGNEGARDASFELSALNGANGFQINGTDNTQFSGCSVSGAGDINGDGIDDLIIGNKDADPGGIDDAGQSYVVFGSEAGFAASLELSALNGANGFAVNGIDPGDLSGRLVSGAGDVNGDGIDDVLIGAVRADPGGRGDAGESYVVFGQAGGFSASLELSSLNGANGFVINGIDPLDRSGVSVSDAGDVNGDGIDDVIVGARFADPNGNLSAGEAYVVFGNNDGFGASLDLTDLDGANGFVINGIDAGDQAGLPVSGAGDINGDGADDVIIGAQNADPDGNTNAGQSYVVFGTPALFAAQISGPWFNAGQSGHGWLIELLTGITPADPDRVNAYWYVYLNGLPVWLIGTGDLTGTGATLDVVMTAGGNFPPAFDANDVELIPWGTLNFDFSVDATGTASWDSLLPEFGSGSLDMVQLAPISGTAASCRSGSYYNPTQNGHGFVVEVVNIGGQDQVILAWYVYLDGEQVWLFGQGPLIGDTAEVPVAVFSGADFPPNFDSADVVNPPWGTVTIRFAGPNSAEVNWVTDSPGYSDGSLEVERLTELKGHACP